MDRNNSHQDIAPPIKFICEVLKVWCLLLSVCHGPDYDTPISRTWVLSQHPFFAQTRSRSYLVTLLQESMLPWMDSLTFCLNALTSWDWPLRPCGSMTCVLMAISPYSSPHWTSLLHMTLQYSQLMTLPTSITMPLTTSYGKQLNTQNFGLRVSGLFPFIVPSQPIRSCALLTCPAVSSASLTVLGNRSHRELMYRYVLLPIFTLMLTPTGCYGTYRPINDDCATKFPRGSSGWSCMDGVTSNGTFPCLCLRHANITPRLPHCKWTVMIVGYGF